LGTRRAEIIAGANAFERDCKIEADDVATHEPGVDDLANQKVVEKISVSKCPSQTDVARGEVSAW
jgi:hypothetical protein